MRLRLYLLALVLFLLVLATPVVLATPAKASDAPIGLHMVGIEVAVPAYIRSGSAYTMTVRFAGVTVGDGVGIWRTSLEATGALDANDMPIACTPDSNLTIVGGAWEMHSLSGDVLGTVSGGQLAFRPDRPILGHCTGPVPVDLLLAVSDASGGYSAVTSATISDGIIDHRLVPPTIGADVLLH